ncbi:MAG: alpha/beta hydrolase [Oscillospiraceae bacterium]|jgi:acetyl esterase/lipase|nr:alpha/beta hydrolase [Oscillospiraceae bacterium]
MPKITDEMIHPELRKTGKSWRRSAQKFSLNKTRVMKALCGLLKGRHSKEMRYEQVYIPRADGSKLRLCVYSPLETKSNLPGVLWIHGGGYSIGVPEQDDSFILRFIKAGACVVVSPDYTLSPDKPYPAALEDCYSALLWLRGRGEAFGMRPDQIFVGGDSAGGGLAAALSLYARDKGEVSVAFQMPLYPMLDDRPTESSRDNDAPVWNSDLNEAAWRLYLGERYGSGDVPAYAAPARAADYGGLPPACSYVGSIEPFLDETAAYIKNLKKCGIPVSFKIFDGCFHGFDIMCPKTNIAKQAADFLTENYKYAAENYFAPQK